MPLFNKKSTKISNPSPPMTKDPYHHDNNNYKNPPIPAAPVPHTIHDNHGSSMMSNGVGGHVHDSATTVTKPQLVFNCQVAHGSPTGFITGFASVKELYQKIAECYDFPMDEVSRCVFSEGNRPQRPAAIDGLLSWVTSTVVTLVYQSELKGGK
ncbi:hypothetical protein AND_005645 [Anopheles darlingi]|uniref:GIPC1-3 GH1 domain-containing protein n=1 Tax=Anopheles darlingi TaxID=43151 RepID=W5JH57_ANODA|nr:hypothetical protein AND_005645 [Anopheles darlingi]